MTWQDILKRDIISFAKKWLKTAPDGALKESIEKMLRMIEQNPVFEPFISGEIARAFSQAGIDYYED